MWVNADEGLEPGQPFDRDLFCVPVESAISGNECAVTGLLLSRTRRRKGEFQRFGLFKKWNDHKFYDRMTTYYENSTRLFDEFEESEGRGIFVFTIV
jgi:hypothetical protein